MEMKLKVLEGKNAGQAIAVGGKKFLIGRAEDCHLRPGSELISRHHCAILIEEGYVGVRDFGSKNGTFVNDERVVGEQELKPGDRLTVGPLRFEVHLAHNIGKKKQPPVHDVKEAVVRTATNAAQEPVDVTEWLNSEATAETAAAHETATFTDTDAIDITAAQEAAEPEPVDRSQPKKLPPGKLPRSTTKDSQDAAASVLSQMRRRR